MKYFKETTKWSTPGDKNGTYYLSDDKSWIVAYMAPGHTEYKYLSRPIRLITRGRKFELVGNGEPDSKYIIPSLPVGMAPAVTTARTEVKGSNGAVYYVTGSDTRMACTCPGFQFRRKCRHIESTIAAKKAK